MNDPLCFVAWRWKPPIGYRSVFSPDTVYALKAMLDRHYHKPHRLICVTDEPDALPGIETIPLWDWGGGIKSPIGRSYPSCYRRLRVFAPDAGEMFGDRLVSIDLDTVIVGDVTPLFDRPEDFVIWNSSDFPKQQYCGSLWMLRTGTRPQVYTEFKPETSPAQSWRAGYRGSDQAWINYMIPNEAMWTKTDGVVSYRKDVAKSGNRLPPDTRIVNFHGKHDPWGKHMRDISWVREFYPMGVAA